MFLGGAPAGPAGTGKTETTKDLGRTLGIFVVVTNCTDQQRYTDMAKIFKGLCQAGLWGCFDEFNRIELPVLSVVAQQVLSITNAKRTSSTTFTFPGDSQVVTLNSDVGYFITMNPGYAGRQELPENLKALFRGVTMMVPDREIIMKVKLCSVGYSSFVELARKFSVLYKLCEQQLSKQKHYDFGLRNILSVLRTAGATKRAETTASEEMLVLRTLRDMNLSKLVSQDIPLFLSLLSDLFPAIAMPSAGTDPVMEKVVAEEIAKNKLIQHPSWVLKISQLYDTTKVRHGIMLVGPAGSGKTTIMNTLSNSLAVTTSIQHKRVKMNPKAIRAEEMFGETDKLSGEWNTGIFAAIWQKFNNRNNAFNTWIVADGPVDAIWIENLNTVLDDNKILTLANGDRISMTDNVKILFEVEDLRNASPATVSRAGIIYVSASDLDWAPVVQRWLNQTDPSQKDVFASLFNKFVGKCEGDKEFGHIFRFVNKNCNAVMSLSRVGIMSRLFGLLDAMLKKAELSTSPSDRDLELERLFLFALLWTVGGLFEEEDRGRFDEYLRTLSNLMPPMADPNDNAFMYQVNSETMEWERWAAPSWSYPTHSEELDFSTLMIPTIDSTRALYLINNFASLKAPVLLTGGSGTSKTVTVEMYIDNLDRDKMLIKRVNFSFATTPGMFQSSVDGDLDKRGGKNYGPPSGKSMLMFLDDLSMPQVNTWGDQTTNELTRQLIETGGYCFLDKDKRGDFKVIEDLRFIGAMGHPTGGKNDIPNRLKRHFFVFNMTVPPVETILNIYGQMMAGRFPASAHPGAFFAYANKAPGLTIDLWRWVRTKMLPSPAKFMYVWNMRELSRVFQGILRTPKASIPNEDVFGQLWRHECARVFKDKLATEGDKAMFQVELDTLTGQMVSDGSAGGDGDASAKGAKRQTTAGQKSGSRARAPSVGNLKGSKPGTSSKNLDKAGGNESSSNLTAEQQEIADKLCADSYFVDFLRDDIYDDDGILVEEAPKIYEKGLDMAALTERASGFLVRYNEEQPGKKMNLILFEDAMRHLMRVSRVVGTARGNLLFVGVGGSGKQSLSRLAGFIAGHQICQIVLTKQYNTTSLMDDFRELYKIAGHQGKGVMFLMTDAEVKDENFLEIINSVLMTGEIANLFPKDELAVMGSDLRPFAIKERPDFVDTPENLVSYFFDRVRSNLHIVLAFSPVNPKLPERVRKFPGIINGCSINYFMEWPKDALVAVSKGFIGKVNIDCEDEVKEALIEHVGEVHNLVVQSCDEYFVKMRRHVYQTPKSYLSFLNSYKQMYDDKLAGIEERSSRVATGLVKLQQGAEDVETMKVVLADEEVKLRKAEEATNAMLSKLEVSSMAAKKEKDAVDVIKRGCEADKERIAGEKALAEEDLAKAQPFVDEAERAVQSIKANDLNELKKMGKPGDIIKLIFDCVALLKMEKMVKIEPTEVILGIGKDKQTLPFFKDSFKIQQTGMLSDSKFLQGIFYFSKYEKDFMNDETIEFLLPYLELQGFDPLVARNASKAAEGLCTWSRAMKYYHEASKIVKPKLEALSLAEAALSDAQRELDKAERKLQDCEGVLQKLQGDFEAQMTTKKEIEEGAARTRRKMEQATALIDGLAGERQRWTDDSHMFNDTRKRLVGDVALACAFISYCGPFNQTFREYLTYTKFTGDLLKKDIPMTKKLQLSDFLADAGTIGDWAMEGLPGDPLSVQNGILVTRSSRYPLLVDPQGQALAWIKNHEKDKLPNFGTTTITHPKLREQLEFCMCEGKALIISGLENELDAMLTPVLEKQIITKAKSKYINIGDKLCEYVEEFMLYLTTRLPNPHFSPEDQAKTLMVDFTVTQKGLEEQLLGRVIGKEQKSLEEQLQGVVEEVTSNTKALLKLDQLLLERLSANTGNLLDDEELIQVLANTKAKATEVNAKLIAAAETQVSINEKREQYRPVATRGSVMYFCIVDVSQVNVMYQTSLDQFQVLFLASMDTAEKAALASKRVGHIVEEMTYNVWRYIDRGLYSRDRNSFKLMLMLKILQTSGRLNSSFVTLFLKAGAALNIADVKAKPYAWMNETSWLNAVQLSTEGGVFQSLLDNIARDEENWKVWYNANEPESMDIPGYETQLRADKELGPFLRMLITRFLREDRTMLAGLEFIKTMDSVDGVPAMGERFVKPVSDTVDAIYSEMTALIPVIYLLSAGADPTDSVEMLAKKKKRDVACVSMGEGQDVVAMKAINSAMVNGSWVMLQNCHLGLDFMAGLEDLMNKIAETCNEDFRLFVTSEPHPEFPIGLLQMCTKITTEPPNGLKAGMLRSYTVIVDQDKLERIESTQWRTLLYGICFLHSVVQERRKFGPLGWCVPYEYNDGDLTACLMFLEKHLYTSTLSWPTLQYMVWEAQYGGKITDNMDRRLFGSYVESWLSPMTLAPSFSFNPQSCINRIPNDFDYTIPQSSDSEEFQGFIKNFPSVDSPEVFGLHPNADLTFRNNEATQLLGTILDTQPKSGGGGGGGGKSREETVAEKCGELLDSSPENYIEDDFLEKIEGMGGLSVPLNIFLMQEVQVFSGVLLRMKRSLTAIQQAIRGEVVTTDEIMAAVNSIFDARVPHSWMYSAGGDEISWIAPTLGLWYSGVGGRDQQLRGWLDGGKRPNCFWLTGFFNAQGFLTAVQQEVTRSHKADKWSLDNVEVHTEVTEYDRAEQVARPPKEGCYVHGLFLEGAAWSKGDISLVESKPKILFAALPVLFCTAITKNQKKSMEGDYGPNGGFECAVYKYPRRTDRFYIFTVVLASREKKPNHWVLRGVALLCTTD
jgi:dynein heavy chain